jgi:class 3 adenylate cyclase
VSERVRAACHGAFRFEPLPPLALQGFSEATRAYRLER